MQGRGRTQIEESIPLEIGDNTIYLTVSDLSGKEVSYDGTYFVEEGDTTPPQTELILEDGRVKISAKDETQIAYISYYWNSEDETRLEAKAESPTLIEERLSVLRGENTLTVVAVDGFRLALRSIFLIKQSNNFKAVSFFLKFDISLN